MLKALNFTNFYCTPLSLLVQMVCLGFFNIAIIKLLKFLFLCIEIWHMCKIDARVKSSDKALCYPLPQYNHRCYQ